jgi:hypothetical protein
LLLGVDTGKPIVGGPILGDTRAAPLVFQAVPRHEIVRILDGIGAADR